jgi:hypothetical protein
MCFTGCTLRGRLDSSLIIPIAYYLLPHTRRIHDFILISAPDASAATTQLAVAISAGTFLASARHVDSAFLIDSITRATTG